MNRWERGKLRAVWTVCVEHLCQLISPAPAVRTGMASFMGQWGEEGGKPGRRRRKRGIIISVQMHSVSERFPCLGGKKSLPLLTNRQKKEEYNGVFVFACVSVYDWCKGIRGPVCGNYSHKSSPCRLYAISPGCTFQFCSAITSSVSVEVCVRTSARVIEPYQEDKQSLPALLITLTLTTPSYKLCVGVWESRRRVGTEL